MPTVKQLIEQDKQPADLAQQIVERAAISPSQLEAAFVLVAADRVAASAAIRLSRVLEGAIHTEIADAEDAADAADDARAIAENNFISLCGHLEVRR